MRNELVLIKIRGGRTLMDRELDVGWGCWIGWLITGNRECWQVMGFMMVKCHELPFFITAASVYRTC